ncbi:MAG: COX15/CtaA family protein [Actinomycetales bacterium]|nr:COX15/CtaA family protein [Actinomycetales bacterium]
MNTNIVSLLQGAAIAFAIVVGLAALAAIIFVKPVRNWVFGASKLRAYIWASLVSQILIVVTGGAVRLTGSGLGCPTWPKCTPESLVNVPEMGIHGIIEFTNRLLTFVLIVISLLTFITIRRLSAVERRGMVWPALAIGLGIFGQAVIGGISVLTKLNPWVVGLHFVLSAALIAIATILVIRFYGVSQAPVATASRLLAWPIALVGLVTLLVGIVVTGAGPHAGDVAAPRNGLDLEILEHTHAYPAYLLLAMSLIALNRQLRAGKNKRLARIQVALVLAELAQAAIGIAQARLGVPPLLVGAHMLGASILAALLTANLVVSRTSKR